MYTKYAFLRNFMDHICGNCIRVLPPMDHICKSRIDKRDKLTCDGELVQLNHKMPLVAEQHGETPLIELRGHEDAACSHHLVARCVVHLDAGGKQIYCL